MMREFLLAAAASFALFGGPAMASQGGGHRVVAGYGHVLHADAGGGDGTGAGNRLADAGGGDGTGAGNRLADAGGGNGGSWVAQQAQA
jgi:hypothetical protein